ncbi:MAG: hypothetical protein HQL78_11585 [Magnetococcales bacterium]|nr:hypothetical protein [Magnetococcales bacterium]
MFFLKIPLWDPNRWLNRHQATIEKAWGWPLWLLAAGIVVWGGIEVALGGLRLVAQAKDILQLNNLLLLYVAIFLSHILHEMAHATTCKHFGGDVRTMGVMLLLLTPLPYVDLSSGWTFRNRWHRALVDAAGMLMDLVLGSLATIVWAYTPPGTANELAYNLIFAIGVHTIIFNINPLMRFDGYYILSDLIEIPNLHEQAKKAFMGVWNRHVLKKMDDKEEGGSFKQRVLLVAFFMGSNCYRVLVMFGIILFVSDQYFGVGLVVAIAMTITSFFYPLKAALAPFKNPLFVHQQKGLLRGGGTAMALVAAFVCFVPMPDSRVLDGVVNAEHNSPIHTEIGGIVQRVLVDSGRWVSAGELLVELVNPEIDGELESVEAQRMQALVQEQKALVEGGVDLDPIRERLNSLESVRQSLERQRISLKHHAPHAGYWVTAEIPFWRSSWVARGAELGRVVDDRSHVFLGVIHQEAALALSELQGVGSEVRIEGERATIYPVTRLNLIPHSQSTLPSAALSPLAGGKTAIKTNDPSGKQSAEPFFLLRAEFSPDPEHRFTYAPRSERSGWIKVRLPSRPLVVQVERAIFQFFQRRYSL